ncbi:MAG: hypothetical protein H4O13_02265 [Xanthomonadales bacterium]|nr:hypothetical protein [Xanthomonadales bacterium]
MARGNAEFFSFALGLQEVGSAPELCERSTSGGSEFGIAGLATTDQVQDELDLC